MFPFFQPKDVEDLHEKLRGKTKRFRLTRNGGALAFTGRLLSLFRRDDAAEAACPPAVGCVDTLAVFATRAGRFLVFYLVLHPDGERPASRREYAHVCPDLPALGDFLHAMAYANKDCFLDRVLTEAGWPGAAGAAPLPLTAPAAPESLAAPAAVEP
jgi:hypothetical protein